MRPGGGAGAGRTDGTFETNGTLQVCKGFMLMLLSYGDRCRESTSKCRKKIPGERLSLVGPGIFLLNARLPRPPTYPGDRAKVRAPTSVSIPHPPS